LSLWKHLLTSVHRMSWQTIAEKLLLIKYKLVERARKAECVSAPVSNKSLVSQRPSENTMPSKEPVLTQTKSPVPVHKHIIRLESPTASRQGSTASNLETHTSVGSNQRVVFRRWWRLLAHLHYAESCVSKEINLHSTRLKHSKKGADEIWKSQVKSLGAHQMLDDIDDALR
jgi:hypothetical protein